MPTTPPLHVPLAFHSPAANDRGPNYARTVFTTLVHQRRLNQAMTLGVTSRGQRVQLWISASPSDERRLAGQLLNAYPGSSLTPLPPAITEVPAGFTTWSATVHLAPDFFPIATSDQFMEQATRQFNDPLTTLFTALQSGRSDRVRATMRLSLRPARRWRIHRAKRLARFMDGACSPADLRHALVRWATSDRFMRRLVAGAVLRFMTPIRAPMREVDEKLSEQLLEAQLRLVVVAPRDAGHVARRKLADLTRSLNPFTTGQVAFERGVMHRSNTFTGPRSWTGRGFLLTPAEAAALWHPPEATVAVPRLDRAAVRELEPPAVLPTGEGEWSITTLGRVRFRQDRRRFGIDLDARRRHLYVVGKTGMGKSTLLHNIVRSDIESGRGVALIDPHGDLAEAVLDCVPARRTNDVVLFDAGDTSHAVAFNPLAVPRGGDPVLVADGVLAAFQKVFGLEEGSAPRLLHILRNSLLTLVGQDGATLLAVQRLLVDAPYRNSLVARVMNPVVRAFWTGEFDRWRPGDRTEYVASLQNKLGAFLTNDKLQQILGQPRGRVDLRQIMDTGQVLVVNLSKGRVGESASRLLGALLVSSLQLAAMSRADVPERDRPDFGIVIDEFQNYATPSIATLLAESRKYHCNLVVAHQFLAQLDDATRDAVIGNVGSMIAFQLGADDGEFFARQLGGGLTDEDLMNLPKYHAYVRPLLDGQPSRPFLMQTLPPAALRKPRAEAIRRTSRQRYARPAAAIEAQIQAIAA